MSCSTSSGASALSTTHPSSKSNAVPCFLPPILSAGFTSTSAERTLGHSDCLCSRMSSMLKLCGHTVTTLSPIGGQWSCPLGSTSSLIRWVLQCPHDSYMFMVNEIDLKSFNSFCIGILLETDKWQLYKSKCACWITAERRLQNTTFTHPSIYPSIDTSMSSCHGVKTGLHPGQLENIPWNWFRNCVLWSMQ